MLLSCYRHGDEDERRSGWRIAFRYDARKIEALKATIPSSEREWHEDVKEWWVAASCERQLRRIFPDFDTYANAPRLL